MFHKGTESGKLLKGQIGSQTPPTGAKRISDEGNTGLSQFGINEF